VGSVVNDHRRGYAGPGGWARPGRRLPLSGRSRSVVIARPSGNAWRRSGASAKRVIIRRRQVGSASSSPRGRREPLQTRRAGKTLLAGDATPNLPAGTGETPPCGRPGSGRCRQDVGADERPSRYRARRAGSRSNRRRPKQTVRPGTHGQCAPGRRVEEKVLGGRHRSQDRPAPRQAHAGELSEGYPARENVADSRSPVAGVKLSHALAGAGGRGGRVFFFFYPLREGGVFWGAGAAALWTSRGQARPARCTSGTVSGCRVGTR